MQMNSIELFTATEGNLLVRLIVAHLLADFIFQTKKMVENKQWFSKAMMQHIGIVFILTLAFTANWKIALLLTLLHYVTDGIKISLKKTQKIKETYLYLADQGVHFVTIVLIWTINQNLFAEVLQTLQLPFLRYNWSVILMGYLLVTTPLGYIIGLATQKIQTQTPDDNITNPEQNTEPKSDRNGLWIGVFERIIILTFVLLEQYEAIGFLITGKSIIRFSAKNEGIRSEYVLLGTMASYGVTILLGVILKYVLLN
jgi:hypothetical protein